LKESKVLQFEFTAEGLKKELYRLKDIFLPEFRVPQIDISIGGRVYSKAALTYYKRNKIVVFKPYHDRFPEDYKITLLHELGHIIADHSHGSNFKKYFTLLWERQSLIEECVIPDSYSDFLFARVSRHYTRKYFCPVCGDDKVYRKRMNVVCDLCNVVMLEDAFFDGIEAIIPFETRESVDRSVVGYGQLISTDVIC